MWGKLTEGADAAASATYQAPALEGFDEAHRELLDDRSIQFNMAPEPPPEPPRLRVNVPEGSGWNWDATPLFQALFWVIVVLAAAALLYFIVTRLMGLRWRRRTRSDAPDTDAWRPSEAASRALLADADALAAEGRYSEAARLLLHRSIADIDERRPESVRPALTSRDIAGLPVLPPSPAQSFAQIVRAVERSLFARRDLDAGDWQECRAAYERFAFAEGWRG